MQLSQKDASSRYEKNLFCTSTVILQHNTFFLPWSPALVRKKKKKSDLENLCELKLSRVLYTGNPEGL